MELDRWYLDYKQYRNLETRLPCSLYSVLLAYGKMDDPFYRTNEAAARELCETGCTFSTHFTLSPEQVSCQHAQVVFHGLDTLCSIYLNGRKLGEADNMHRTWRFDIRPFVHEGRNILKLCFHSPLAYVRDRQASHRTAGPDHTEPGIAHIRKAHCMFGWDWGPKLPDMGIFRPVELLFYDTARITDVLITQHHTRDAVSLRIGCETDAPEALASQLTLTCELTDEAGEPVAHALLLPARTDNAHLIGSPCAAESTAHGQSFSECGGAPASVQAEQQTPIYHIMEPFHSGMHLDAPVAYTGDMHLDAPQLWWPHGYGDQPLYTLTVTLALSGTVLDRRTKRIGLRTLTVDTSPDKWGHCFCFVVNGVKIFAMGADYIPEDSILPHCSPERTEQLILDCIHANFNCLRVWGGGYYPDDYFFDLCDQYGLIVWQDFMFACVNAYLTEPFTKNLIAEFTDNIRRIRHHASLGLLCGNNEMEQAICDWGGYREDALAKLDYLRLYEHILPDLCARYAPQTFYWPASPSSGGGFDDPNDENRGDVHYWGAWHGDIPFESYRSYYFRFLSEFGFESFPSIKTIRTFAEETDLNPFSEVMESHQKCVGGNKKIISYAADRYLYATSFDALVYVSQILQADAIRLGVEHLRRNRGRCMGSIYWQVNDCWPVASWSSIDYCGRKKALHYAARGFFAPVLLSAHDDGYDVTLNVSNETRQPFSGTIRYGIYDTSFAEIWSESMAVEVGALRARDVALVELEAHVRGRERDCFFAYQLYDADGQLLSDRSLLFTQPKLFYFREPHFTARLSKTSVDTVKIEVSAETYAKAVQIDFDGIDLTFSDNFFDITSTAPVVVTAFCENPSIENLAALIRFKSVYDVR